MPYKFTKTCIFLNSIVQLCSISPNSYNFDRTVPQHISYNVIFSTGQLQYSSINSNGEHADKPICAMDKGIPHDRFSPGDMCKRHPHCEAPYLFPLCLMPLPKMSEQCDFCCEN